MAYNRIRFNFQVEASELYGRVPRPTAEVHLRTGRNSWQLYFMYVDSGADYSIVSESVGTLLGFVKRRGEHVYRSRGIAGSVPCLMRRVQMRIGPNELEADLGWAQSDEVPLLLGRHDVFDKFDVTLRQRLSETEFVWRG